jgi:two-component system cell cycle sensor histidine kinase/response regulator CckA
VQDRESLEHEAEILRQRVSDLQRQLALYSRLEFDGQERAGIAVSLVEREELLKEAERIAHLGTWVWNLETDSVYWSEELFRLLGYDPARDQASTEAFFAAVHPDDRATMRETSASSVASGVSRRTEFRVLTHDGVLRYVSMDAAFLFDDDSQPRRVLGTVLDITQMRGLQEKLTQAEKMEAIGRLAAGVAHDFNNVLTVVRGNLDLGNLADTPELRQVFAALESASDLTTRLLTLGRRSALRRRPVDLCALVQKTVGLVERMLREHIAVRVRVAEAQLFVEVDETLIEQALVNLLLNARDALAAGGSVEVSVRAVEDPSGRDVELCVRDDGPGMSDATRSRVFDPFFTTKNNASSHGLGLAMVHGTVAQHGGTVTVESAQGQGTMFRLRFPRVERPQVAPAEATAQRVLSLAAPCRIVVVEDQEIVGHTIRRLLERMGHQVAFAATPALSLALVAQSAFDVVLCDVVMPEMRGPALIERMRELYPESARRVIYMTGNSGDAVELLPGVDLLSKPFTSQQLADAVARAFVSR